MHLIYDLEIKKAILGKGEVAQEGIEYYAGWHAPVLYQHGQYGELIDYCLNDCYITGALFDAAQSRALISPKGGVLSLRQLAVKEAT